MLAEFEGSASGCGCELVVVVVAFEVVVVVVALEVAFMVEANVEEAVLVDLSWDARVSGLGVRFQGWL